MNNPGVKLQELLYVKFMIEWGCKIKKMQYSFLS